MIHLKQYAPAFITPRNVKNALSDIHARLSTQMHVFQFQRKGTCADAQFFVREKYEVSKNAKRNDQQ